MRNTELTVEDLLLGAGNIFEVVVPAEVVYPGGREAGSEKVMTVQLRPLTIGTFQLIMKAARQDAGLIPLLMIKDSMVQPSLSLEQVKQLHLGLVNFLIGNIREISGLTGKKNTLPT